MPSGSKYSTAELHSFGFVEVNKDMEIYYEQRGNPNGPSVVYNHGGPGGFSKPENSQWFDPEYYNIILYDQRGTGRSRPSVASPETHPTQFASLTVEAMAADLEALRMALGIDKWLVFGGSWGSTLSIFYAAKYPKSITGVIVYGIFLNTIDEMKQYFDPKIVKTRFPELGSEALGCLFSYAQLKNVTIDPNSLQSFMKTFYQLCVEEDDHIAQYLWINYERFNDQPTQESLERLRNVPETIEPTDRTYAVFENIIFNLVYQEFNLLDKPLLSNLKEVDIRIVQGNEDTETPPIFAQQLVTALLELKPNLWFRFIDGKHSGDSSEDMTLTLLACTNSFKNTKILNEAPPPKSSLSKEHTSSYFMMNFLAHPATLPSFLIMVGALSLTFNRVDLFGITTGLAILSSKNSLGASVAKIVSGAACGIYRFFIAPNPGELDRQRLNPEVSPGNF